MFLKLVEYDFSHQTVAHEFRRWINTDQVTQIIEHPDENLFEVILSGNDNAVWLNMAEFARLSSALELEQ